VSARFWRRIACPTLHVGGSESDVLPADERDRRLACFPRVTCVTLAGAGHMIQRHQPAALARLIDEFLSGMP
jgi:pimeloyl-ACP methyl ester carboxylesterase